jgi:hypothetical protein
MLRINPKIVSGLPGETAAHFFKDFLTRFPKPSWIGDRQIRDVICHIQ